MFGCLFAASIALNLIFFVASAMYAGQDQPAQTLNEVWLEGQAKDKIVEIPVRGAIIEESSSLSTTADSQTLVAQLQKALKDPQVKGVLIQANSPGGSVTASDKVYQAVVALREAKKPVVVLMHDTCASGCVYLAAPANLIVAHPTTVTGSIGVMMMTLNISKFLDHHGIQGVTITSKENKALLSPLQPIQPEHKQIVKVIIDEMFERFVGIVSKWRNIPKDDLLKFADGRIFIAAKAKDYKLIDAIGYRKDALKSLKELAKIKDARIVTYRRQVGWSDIFRSYAQLPNRIANNSRFSIQDLLRFDTPTAYYIWSPNPAQ
jgi:protease-4